MIKKQEKVLVFKDIKNKRWTIWNQTKTKHIGYAKNLYIKKATFIVIESKRKQVIKTKKRFPHAWIIGEIEFLDSFECKKEVTYNPFKDHFFKSNGKLVKKAKKVKLSSNQKVYI